MTDVNATNGARAQAISVSIAPEFHARVGGDVVLYRPIHPCPSQGRERVAAKAFNSVLPHAHYTGRVFDVRDRPGAHADFHRLAAGLKYMKVDFHYRETRKLLDPNWDGYIDGMDVIENDCALADANIVTSKCRDSNLHRPVLDLDNGATSDHKRLLLNTGGALAISWTVAEDFALVPSTTPGHCHLMIDMTYSWDMYRGWLCSLMDFGVLEAGYVKASIARGFSAIRPPWVRKVPPPWRSVNVAGTLDI